MKSLYMPIGLALIVAGFSVLYNCSQPTDVAGGGTEAGNALVAGYIYNSNGTPAAGAVVQFVAVDQNPRTGVSIAAVETTDAKGKYSIKSMAAKTYNLIGHGSGGAVYHDSIEVEDDTLELRDTLKAPGTLRGVVKLEHEVDSGYIFVILLGTNMYAMADSNGSFVLANIAAGTYQALVLTTVSDFAQVDTELTVREGLDEVMVDTIVLKSIGIPVPTGLSIAYDTLKQIVFVTWNHMDQANVIGYNIYRRISNPDSSFALRKGNIIDTFFYDTTCIEGLSYDYAITSINQDGVGGVQCSWNTVIIASAFRYLGVFGSAGTGVGQYNNPMAIAVSHNRILVADLLSDGRSGKIIVYNSGGDYVKEMTPFSYPVGLATRSDGAFYVMDGLHSTITYVTSGDSIAATFGGKGSAPGFFNQLGLWQMAIAPNGGLYITDPNNNRIQVFDSLGNYQREFTCGEPMGITFQDSNKVVIALGSPVKIVLSDTNGVFHAEWVGWGSLGVTPRMNIYNFYDGSGSARVLFYSSNGELIARFGHNGQDQNGFELLRYAAVDLTRIFIADNTQRKIIYFLLPGDL